MTVPLAMVRWRVCPSDLPHMRSKTLVVRAEVKTFAGDLENIRLQPASRMWSADVSPTRAAKNPCARFSQLTCPCRGGKLSGRE